jgi:hypothetical protein
MSNHQPSTKVGQLQPGLWIAYGNTDTLSDHGVNWNYSLSSVPIPGSIAMQQVVTVNNTAYTGSSPTPIGNPCNACADGGFPYASPTPSSVAWTANDAPGQQLSTTNTSSFTSAQLNYTFSDYLMYQPQNDNLGTSIWITLAMASWTFSTSATNNNNTWTPSNTNAGGSQFSPSYQLPSWNSVEP